MSAPRFGRIHKATALLPLAVLSTAWTASLAGVGGGTVAVASDSGPALPDGTTVPTEAIEAPASVSLPDAVAPAVPKGQAGDAVRGASASGIPSAALAAYQRAETVINAADKTCKVPWQLIAAIGRVESDHGRYGGNVLNGQGVATPGIYGIALDGSNDTQRILDTDAGQYDDDGKFDRAVGPMQFIPSTWSVVGVDGDNDGKRNPQDIDDAALATAVYLCSGNDDLSQEKGQRASVYRYNHSNAYVDLVLSIMAAYMDGDYTAVPNGTTTAGTMTRDAGTPLAPAVRGPVRQPQKDPGPAAPSAPSTIEPSESQESSDGPQQDEPTQQEPSNPTPQQPKPPKPPKNPVDDVREQVEDTVKDPGGTVKDTLTRAEATTRCLAELGASSVGSLNPLQLTELNQCVNRLLG